MADENKNTPPEQKPDADLKNELERARSSNKTLKAAAAGLALLFLILAGVAFFAYRRIAMTKALFEEAVQGGQQPPPVSPESRAIPPGLNPYSALSSTTPISGLGLFAGAMPEGGQEGGEAALTPADTAKVAQVMDKYSQRPIWKELMADLKKDPEMARAMDAGKGGNPLAMMGTMKNSKNLNKILMKYAARPEFLKLMMDLSTDSDLTPMLKKLPAGSIPGAGGAAVPPAAQPEEGPDGPMLLDPSAISGTSSADKARISKAPPPLENN